MAMPFNADEVFEMAEQIERNGGKFYRAAAEKFPAVRELLLKLAEMEDNHERTFANMRAELSTKETAQTVFDPDSFIYRNKYLIILILEYIPLFFELVSPDVTFVKNRVGCAAFP